MWISNMVSEIAHSMFAWNVIQAHNSKILYLKMNKNQIKFICEKCFSLALHDLIVSGELKVEYAELRTGK